MFRIYIDPHRHISAALEEAVRGWLFNDLPDTLVDEPWESLITDSGTAQDRRNTLIDRLDNRFWCAIEERGIEFTDD